MMPFFQLPESRGKEKTGEKRERRREKCSREFSFTLNRTLDSGEDLLKKAGKWKREEGILREGRKRVLSFSCSQSGISASKADGRSELTSLKKKSFFRTVYNENQRKNEFFLFFLCIRT